MKKIFALTLGVFLGGALFTRSFAQEGLRGNWIGFRVQNIYISAEAVEADGIHFPFDSESVTDARVIDDNCRTTTRLARVVGDSTIVLLTSWRFRRLSGQEDHAICWFSSSSQGFGFPRYFSQLVLTLGDSGEMRARLIKVDGRFDTSKLSSMNLLDPWLADRLTAARVEITEKTDVLERVSNQVPAGYPKRLPNNPEGKSFGERIIEDPDIPFSENIEDRRRLRGSSLLVPLRTSAAPAGE